MRGMATERPLQDHRQLPTGDVRAERTYLAAHVFLDVPGAGKSPSDMSEQGAWEGMMGYRVKVAHASELLACRLR
jgi:hypothetical protein